MEGPRSVAALSFKGHFYLFPKHCVHTYIGDLIGVKDECLIGGDHRSAFRLRRRRLAEFGGHGRVLFESVAPCTFFDLVINFRRASEASCFGGLKSTFRQRCKIGVVL